MLPCPCPCLARAQGGGRGGGRGEEESGAPPHPLARFGTTSGRSRRIHEGVDPRGCLPPRRAECPIRMRHEGLLQHSAQRAGLRGGLPHAAPDVVAEAEPRVKATIPHARAGVNGLFTFPPRCLFPPRECTPPVDPHRGAHRLSDLFLSDLRFVRPACTASGTGKPRWCGTRMTGLPSFGLALIVLAVAPGGLPTLRARRQDKTTARETGCLLTRRPA